MKTKVIGRYVVGFDGQDHVVYRDGEVVYEGDTIVYVGHEYPQPVDTTIDLGESIISPGFVDLNALADIDHTVMHYEAPSDVSTGLMWSQQYVQDGPHAVLTPEEREQESLYALAHLIRNGITTALPVTSLRYTAWAETCEEYARVAGLAAALGLRTYLGPTYRSGVKVIRPDGTSAFHWDVPRGEAGLDQAVDFVRAHDRSHGGLVRGMLVPSTADTCTSELLQQTKRYSEELACPIRLHAAQSMREVQLIQEWHHQTPVQSLHSLGFLGPRTLIAHAV